MLYHPALDLTQGVLGRAAHHQGPICQVLLRNLRFLGQWVILPGHQINLAVKQRMQLHLWQMTHIPLVGKADIVLAFKKCFDAPMPIKARGYRNPRMLLFETLQGLGQKVQRRTDGHYQPEILLEPSRKVLSLLYGNPQFCHHILQGSDKLLPGWGQSCPPAGTVKQPETDFLLCQFNLIGQGGLGNIKVFRRPVKVAGSGQLQNIFHLFGIHTRPSLSIH